MMRTIMEKYAEELQESNKIIGMTEEKVAELPIIQDLCDIYKEDKENNLTLIDVIIALYSVVPATEKRSVNTINKLNGLISALENIIKENIEIFALGESQKQKMFNIALQHILNRSELAKSLSIDTIENVYVVDPIKNLLND